MFAIKLSIILTIGSGSAVAQSFSCKNGYYQMCCEADYDVPVPITTCEYLVSLEYKDLADSRNSQASHSARCHSTAMATHTATTVSTP